MDYFNASEREGQLRFASKRDRMFKPIVTLLIRLNITPNQVSAFGVALLLAGAACPARLFPLMMVLVSLYVVSDGIDGCLARVTGKTSEGGSLVDIVVDQAGPVIIAAASTIHIPTMPSLAVLFSNLYLITIGLILYVNNKDIEVKFTIFRIKYLFYICYALSFIIKFDILSYFMGLASIYYAIIIVILLNIVCRHYDAKSKQ
ncbi:MAG: CDP-alcohol phosphatidyltransferase family protein [Deltaproteobacteria bacterium]|jgi:phosphatidylglycerophosphate synthase|nr:CDP-alcohol phosphatidyltransferase family protein [Deltaproteobacteria bacterium]